MESFQNLSHSERFTRPLAFKAFSDVASWRRSRARQGSADHSGWWKDAEEIPATPMVREEPEEDVEANADEDMGISMLLRPRLCEGDGE